MSDKRRGWNSSLPAPSKPLRSKTRLRATGKRRKAYRHLTDESYRRWIAERPCLLRGKPGHVCGASEPAHIDDADRGAPDRGDIIPLCGMAHRLSPQSWHMAGRYSFCRHWGLTMESLRETAKNLAEHYAERVEEAW